MKRLSIQLKVTLWYTLLMVVLGCMAVGFLLHAGSRTAQGDIQARMQAMVAESRRELDADDGQLEIDSDLEYFRDGVYLSVYDTAGLPLYGAVPRTFDNSALFADGRMRTVRGQEGSWYVYDARVTVYGWGDVWVRTVAAAGRVDATIASLVRLAGVVLPFYVLAAALSGYFVTKRALGPVRRITQTAREIGRGGDLSRRIDLGPGGDEIHRLADAFNGMFARLEQAFRNEKQFTSDASHELRTPVAVILGQCEDALENAGSLEEAKEALRTVEGQARKMAALIGQLLTLARTDPAARKLQTEPVDLSGLAAAVAEQMEEAARARGIALTADIAPSLVVEGDETMLMRLLINLLDNAVKYGRPGGHVALTLGLAPDGSRVQGSVADDGPGIPPDQLPMVWQRFWQADPARSGGGAGLGLAMVRWIAEAHGGTASAESELGKGSVFSFTLPLRPAEAGKEE